VILPRKAFSFCVLLDLDFRSSWETPGPLVVFSTVGHDSRLPTSILTMACAHGALSPSYRSSSPNGSLFGKAPVIAAPPAFSSGHPGIGFRNPFLTLFCRAVLTRLSVEFAFTKLFGSGWVFPPPSHPVLSIEQTCQTFFDARFSVVS